MGQSLGVSHGTALGSGGLGQAGQPGRLGQSGQRDSCRAITDVARLGPYSIALPSPEWPVIQIPKE
jgi:hypothetical protein